MRQFNINRKVLYTVLVIVMICVFSLTIAYAALNAVLTISGNAEVVASDWRIYLANPKVKSGSVNNNVPTINGNTLNFNTTLTIPGDYYEFTVEVVNDGTIDAMIDSVTKSPELSSEQAKYLKYEVTYQNGESINSKQTLYKKTAMPIKVRIEYRKDLVESDLPTDNLSLNLSLTLHYVQSDGTGSNVSNSGIDISADGSLDDIGTIVTIGSEQFYTIGTEGNNVKLLSMYNLSVGNITTHVNEENEFVTTPMENTTGMQDSNMIGSQWDSDFNPINFPWFGTAAFYDVSLYANNDEGYVGSIIEGYVNNYKSLLESKFGVKIEQARLMIYDEISDVQFGCNTVGLNCLASPYKWLYSSSYWIGTIYNGAKVWYVLSNGYWGAEYFDSIHGLGVRPVIVMSKDYFN